MEETTKTNVKRGLKITMKTAQEAFDATIKVTENISTIDAMLLLASRIEQAIEKGIFVTQSDPMSVSEAEKLSIEMEEYGYHSTTTGTNMMNEKKEPLACVIVNWRFNPVSWSKVKVVESCN